MTKALVIFHKNCPSGDGFASAFAAWLALGDQAEYLAADYGDELPPADGRHVFILDLSFEAVQLEALSREAASLTLLDHHLTAKEKLRGFKPLCCGKIHFDLEQCGCVLTWQHFHAGKPIPALFRWIQARDLWTWDMPGAEDFLAWLDTQPKDFATWQRILELSPQQTLDTIEKGALLREQIERICESIASKASHVTIAGQVGLMVNASGEFRSQVGSALAKRSGTFGLVWRVSERGEVLCSLRALQGYDVEVLARRFGGGGHLTAASFKLAASELQGLAGGYIKAPQHRAAS